MPEYRLFGAYRAALPRIRAPAEDGTRFFVLPGHEDPAVETIVAATEHYVVVEKIGVASEISESVDPRENGGTP